MIVLAYLPEIVCVVGLAIYVWSRPEQTKAVEIGRIMFFCGLLATLLTIHH